MSSTMTPSHCPDGSRVQGTDTFHGFAELPAEIQSQIWLTAAKDTLGGGRVYQLVMTASLISTLGEHLGTGRRFSCSLSVPSPTVTAIKEACALLGTCVESRKAALKLAPDELVLKTPESAPQTDDDGNYIREADHGRATGVFHFNSCEDIIWFDDMNADFLLGRISTNDETIDWTKHIWMAVQNIGLGPKALRSLREGPSSPYGPRHIARVLHPFWEPEQKFFASLNNLRRLFVVDKVSAEELVQCDETQGWDRWLIGRSPEQDTRAEPDERLRNLRGQFRYILNLPNMDMSHFKQYEKLAARFERLECGVLRLCDSVPHLSWVMNLGSDEMLADTADDTGDNDDTQDAFWGDQVFSAAPTALHYIRR